MPQRRLMMPAPGVFPIKKRAGKPMYPQLSELTAQLATRLLRGEHLTLWGPRGSGKSTVLAQVQARLGAAAAP